MHGGDAYTAHERIVAVHPRFTALGRAPDDTRAAAADVDEVVTFEGIDVHALLDALADRWASVRESIGETTFYLTDPNSWR